MRLPWLRVPERLAAVDYESGGLALAVPSTPQPRSTDGSSLPQCAILSGDRHFTLLGKGAPIAWISNSNILCAVGRPSGLDVCAEVPSTSGSPVKRYSDFGLAVAWDGEHVLLSKQGTVELLDKGLSGRLSSIRIPEYLDSRWSFPPPVLVGIPSNAVKTMAR